MRSALSSLARATSRAARGLADAASGLSDMLSTESAPEPTRAPGTHGGSGEMSSTLADEYEPASVEDNLAHVSWLEGEPPADADTRGTFFFIEDVIRYVSEIPVKVYVYRVAPGVWVVAVGSSDEDDK